jgi:hypothetical protein
MYYLWNTGALSQRLVEHVNKQTGLELFLVDHPVPQDAAKSSSYDEGAAIIGGFIAVCSNRELTQREKDLVSDYWTGKRK